MREHRNRSSKGLAGAGAIAVPSGAETLARRFYVGLLGLHETRTNTRHRAVLRPECVSFTTSRPRAGINGDLRSCRPEGAQLLVRDLAALVNQLLDLGRRVDEDASTTARRASFWDPFGNHVTLLQVPPPAP